MYSHNQSLQIINAISNKYDTTFNKKKRNISTTALVIYHFLTDYPVGKQLKNRVLFLKFGILLLSILKSITENNLTENKFH